MWYDRVSGLVMQIYVRLDIKLVICAEQREKRSLSPGKKACSTEHLVNSLKVGWTRREIKNFNDIDNIGQIGLHILFRCIVISKSLEFFRTQTKVVLKLFWNIEATAGEMECKIHCEFRWSNNNSTYLTMTYWQLSPWRLINAVQYFLAQGHWRYYCFAASL